MFRRPAPGHGKYVLLLVRREEGAGFLAGGSGVLDAVGDVGEFGGDVAAFFAHGGGPEPAGGVGGADQGAGHGAGEADFLGFGLEVHEFLGFDPAVHGQVPFTGAEVLGDGDQVTARGVEVAEGFGDFFPGFAHAQDEVGLGDHAQVPALGDDVQGAFVAESGADPLEDPGHGFDV